MITLDQVRALESRIEKAVVLVEDLKAENLGLRSEAERLRGRERELETRIREFQQDQARIEEGIVHALERLDAFEDLVLAAPAAAAPDMEAPKATEPATPREEAILSFDGESEAEAPVKPVVADLADQAKPADEGLSLDLEPEPRPENELEIF